MAVKDINHILVTGQSLSIGATGLPLSVAQPYSNKMFVTGLEAGSAGMTSLIDLVATTAESPAICMADWITSASGTHVSLVSGHGVGGEAYSGLAKGTAPYANGMAQVDAGVSVSAGLSQTYAVQAVMCVHGESDAGLANLGYADNLATWQSDYESDIRAKTGQSEPVPMLHSQISSWTKSAGVATAVVPKLQAEASLRNPSAIPLVGPKYFLPYTDGLHLTNEGYRQLGEYYGKVYKKIVIDGGIWEPLRPFAIRLSGREVTIKFLVPSGSLVLDTTLVSDPGSYGFEFTENGVAVGIASVSVSSADTVTVTLVREPSAVPCRIRYAWTGTPTANAGPTTGPRGCLRDSDAATSRHGYALYNWCIHFDEPCPRPNSSRLFGSTANYWAK